MTIAELVADYRAVEREWRSKPVCSADDERLLEELYGPDSDALYAEIAEATPDTAEDVISLLDFAIDQAELVFGEEAGFEMAPAEEQIWNALHKARAWIAERMTETSAAGHG